MRNNYFNITEFIIDPELREPEANIPVHVADKIIQHHLPVLNQLRSALDAPIYISKHSGWRSVAWEKDRGRSGDSEHTFKGLGAVDVSVSDNQQKMHDMLLSSAYLRICWYPKSQFWHCDYGRSDGQKVYFVNKSDGWEFQSFRT